MTPLTPIRLFRSETAQFTNLQASSREAAKSAKKTPP